MLQGFVEILKQTYKVSLRNGNLIPFITLLFLLLHTILFLSNFFSIKSFIKNLVLKLFNFLLVLNGPSSSSSDFTKLLIVMKDDVQVVAGLEFVFLVATSFASLFFSAATIIASAATFGGKGLYLKDLLSRLWMSWKRAFVTLFYVTLLNLGYSIFVISFVLPLVLTVGIEFIMSAFHVTAIAATIFYCYLSVVWNLAIVVSVLEEKCGIEALGKAGRLVEGMKLEGFLLNLVFGALYYVLFQVFKTISGNRSEAMILTVSLLCLDFLRLIRMFSMVAYTVLYRECKKSHGEEIIEMQESVEYAKVPSNTAPLMAADVP